jgi:hypothetical protein
MSALIMEKFTGVQCSKLESLDGQQMVPILTKEKKNQVAFCLCGSPAQGLQAFLLI